MAPATKRSPLVSVGMPVYNGEDLIATALDSILNQTYQNIELVIVDNASTDDTAKVCREYVETDQRVRYVRNKRNIGVARNFNRAFELSTGKYFKWAAHDDWIAPLFIADCVTALEADDSSVLCWTNSRFIDAAGNLSDEQPFAGSPYLLSSQASLRQRFRQALYAYPGPTLYGLIRTDALRRTQLFRGTVGSDRVLLAELSMLGGFSWVSDVLFFERHWPGMRVGHYTSSYWDPDRWRIGVTMGYVVQAGQCMSVILRARLRPTTTGTLSGIVAVKYARRISRRVLWSLRELTKRSPHREC